MNALRRFLKIGVVLLLIAIGAVVFVWSRLQDLGVSNPTIDTAVDTASKLSEPLREAITNTAPGSDDTDTPAVTTSGSKASVRASDLPLTESQKNMAKTFGINLDTLIITPAMQTCAEGKLGDARYAEILSGSAPGMTESVSLLGCLSAK